MSRVSEEKPQPLNVQSDNNPEILPFGFYTRPTLVVARELLGKKLVRVVDHLQLAGIICETEAYIGENDLGCHARAGKTKRTFIMYGLAGHAYVYFTYGTHWMFNVVSEKEGFPAAVLIRAVKPVEGLDVIRKIRPAGDTNGPAKLTQAFAINGSLNGIDLTNREFGLWIEKGDPILPKEITTGPRVGLDTVPEPWKSIPWRFRTDPSQVGSIRK